jgi:DNA (cytosine-5)-methyltransferase 1
MLVLSLFPGIGLLDRAFEEAGFCVVRGPDVLWGGDIRQFHPPPAVFSGVIGGPPCQAFSSLAHLVRHVHGDAAIAENLIPEFERVVGEAQPGWFLMENVLAAPVPSITGYAVADTPLQNRSFGGVQSRARRFSFGVRGDVKINLLRYLDFEIFEPPEFEYAVTAAAHGGGSGLKYDRGGTKRPQRTVERRAEAAARTVAEKCVLQGLPADFLDKAPFTDKGKHQVVGNGVPLPLGRAIAKAIKDALASARTADPGAQGE